MRGRKTKYNPQYHPLIVKYMAMGGLIDIEIAKELGIHKATLYRWEKQYPEFCDSLKKGKMYVDCIVQDALFKRCTGYYTYEIETIYEKINGYWELIKIKVKQKYTPPSVLACIFWLTHRLPQEWKR